jgi:hypothetical protein
LGAGHRMLRAYEVPFSASLSRISTYTLSFNRTS